MMTLSSMKIRQTGDDRPVPSVWAYVWRMSGRHQVAACVIASVVAALNLAPIELQRRIVNVAVADAEFALLAALCGVYLAAILLHGSLKFALAVYQGWIGESATLYTRRHLASVGIAAAQNARPPASAPDHGADRSNEAGTRVSILGQEVDKLGGFVGEGPSQAAVNLTFLAFIVAYMFLVAPDIALFSLMFLLPQVGLTPFFQKRLNRLTELRLSMMRKMGDVAVADTENGESPAPRRFESLTRHIYANRIKFFVWKFGTKAVLNFLNALAPLSVLFYGGYLIMQGRAEVGTIVAFISGFQRMSNPIRELIAFYRMAALASVQHEMIATWLTKKVKPST